MSNINLYYQGTVNIILGEKRHSFKNNGTPKLFELIARFLAGQEPPKSLLPHHIKLFGRTSNTNEIEITYYSLPITATPVATSTGYACMITSSILPTNINSSDINSNDPKYRMVLYSKEDLALASINVSKEIIDEVDEGRQALIEWSLEFLNSNNDINLGGSN